MNHLFAGADKDNDGNLSFEEILDNHDLFVGSEVIKQVGVARGNYRKREKYLY